MQGRKKLLLILVLVALCLTFLPVIAEPLPYAGLDWLSYGEKIYYPSEHRVYLPIVLRLSQQTMP